MFNNTTNSTRDAASDMPPESPPSSGESQTASPSSDSVPLPGSLTLTFLAAALSNALLEGAPPGISPSTQAATSTGEVPVQSGKKKRGLTNLNNLFKPSSGSTTARNLCGIEWQAQCKMSTVAEFTTHWNSLTPQQREPYITRSKLADTANLLVSSISLASDDSALNAGNSISHTLGTTMFPESSGQRSQLQRLVDEKSSWWRVTSRKTDGQEYVWVVINAIHPRVGPAPPRPDQRTDKTLSNGVLQDHDWSTTPDHWDISRPYRPYIPDLPKTQLFPDSSWIATAWPLGSDWGISGPGGWCLSSEMRTKLLATRANAYTLVGAIISAYKPWYIIPTELRLDWIDNSFPSEEVLAAQVGDVRQHILDQYGFIAYNLRQDPHWRTHPGLRAHILRVTNTGLDSCWHIGCIMDFKRMDFFVSELYDLISHDVPIHYQWFPADAGPFDPRALRANDYDFIQNIRRTQVEWQWSTAAQSANSMDPPAVPPPAQKKAKYFKASRRFKTDTWEEISKNAYKELSNWCAAECVKLPTRDVFVTYEYEGADEEYVAPVGSVISAKEMAAYVLGIAAQPNPISAVINTKEMAAHALELAAQPTTVSAPSAATLALTTGESSSSAQSGLRPAKKDSPAAATPTAEPSTLEHSEPVPVTKVTPRATVPNIVIRAQSRSPGAESAISLGEEDDVPFSFGSHVAPRAPDYTPVSPRSPSPSLAVTVPLPAPSSSRLPPPHRQKCLVFLDDYSSSSRKRTISFVSSPSGAGENKRPRMAAPPTSSRPTLMQRLHGVIATFPAASPLAPEPSPPQQLPLAQVQILPVRVEVGLPLIAESYQANELQIDGPVFMMGITFPAAPVLRSGRLTTTFQSAIWVVYDQLLSPNASPADSLQTLLRSGAPFRVFAPLPNTAFQQLAVAPSYLLRRNVFQGFDLTNLGYWNIYTSQVRELLCRPFACCFLTLGGILWRIALQFGPNTLVQEALVGPSSAVMLWGSGELVSNLWDDFVTPEEINTLLGRSHSGSESCWPPNDLWDSSKKWKGFWSDADEAWFQLHLANLLSGNLQAPKSWRTWKTSFRPAKLDTPLEIYAQELFKKLGYDNVRAPTWDL
ncbi:uncharacterized protein EDB91DRAFT_1080983 [Suillus paluster]|uniref:uncharacterized protein n=1 Tax=Suillus paluster TaxID=48578 RepID=UPI001B86B08C|nr:uncharacterized protein EDB91DRAFT_1080983 [Suillus paluster]KAG1743580.1 hypothetical protein EDB91DRAFT_1080983 [Suillus paluster]